MKFTRRECIGKIGGCLAGFLFEPVLSAEEFFCGWMKKHGVILEHDFNSEELSDFEQILDSYSSLIGDLRAFSFNFRKMKFDKDYCCLQVRSEGTFHPNPLSGYWSRGFTSPVTHKITLAPKKALEDFEIFLYKRNLIPLGEEGRTHGFRWTLAHEMAHSLAFKLGFGYELMGLFSLPDNVKYPFSKEWINLSWRIKENIKNAEHRSFKGRKKRVEGFPTYYSYFGSRGRSSEHETFADCVAYLVTGSSYAEGDVFLEKRLDLILEKFNGIRQNGHGQLLAPPPVRDYKKKFSNSFYPRVLQK